MEKKIIIVGAGIAGLSAGYYARLNGYGTTIYELHTLAGGLCTAWGKKGYKFDISMHMLTGSVSGPFHQMWKELGVIDEFDFYFHDEMSRIEGRENQVTFPVDRKAFENELTAISPEDAPLIREFSRLLFGPDMMKAASLKPKKLQNTGDSIRMLFAILPLLRVFTRYNRMTITEFASRFKHPFLREAIRFYIDAPGWPMKEFPVVALAGFVRNSITEAGAPLGGSQQVVFHIAKNYKKAGGEIRFKSRVTDLILDGDRVQGIVLEDGTEQRADEVIWAGDGHTLIYDILKGKYVSEQISAMYREWIPVKPMVHVMMGVDMDLSQEPPRVLFEPEKPITIAGREHRWMTFLHHCFDRSMAPEGKSAVEVWYDTEYDYWENLYTDKKAYRAEKKRIADYTVAMLDKRWPGFAEKVEMIDVPTPATYHRYTANWKGSPDGWYITAGNMRVQEPVRNLPGLEGLHMIGQWTAPFTGTVIAALTGRQVIQLMCRKDKKPFQTTGQQP